VGMQDQPLHVTAHEATYSSRHRVFSLRGHLVCFMGTPAPFVQRLPERRPGCPPQPTALPWTSVLVACCVCGAFRPGWCCDVSSVCAHAASKTLSFAHGMQKQHAKSNQILSSHRSGQVTICQLLLATLHFRVSCR